jgi:hypothetical protein
MIPQIENSILNTPIEIITYPSKTYKMTDKQIAGYVDDIDAIKQAVYHILSIERYAYAIYDDNYGVEFEKYIGQGFHFLKSTIQDTLKEALLQDDRIENVEVTNVTEEIVDISKDNNTYGSTIDKIKVANVEFNVYCKQGIINMEVKVNV